MDRNITLVNLLTLGIATAAFLLSALNLWIAQVRRGRILLTQPTIFYFGWDINRGESAPKIMFRSALFSSGGRGRVIENLHVLVRTEDGVSEFPLWGHDEGKGMARGSGVFVGANGYVAYHHFNPVNDEHVFAYTGSKYEVQVHAKLFNQDRSTLLGSYHLELDDADAIVGLANGDGGVIWNWSPQENRYYSKYSARPFDWPDALKNIVGIDS
jgi:hypothetical protein